MNSISGANQPVAIGTGKLIKHLNIPVYYSLIQGGYLTSPKYALDERRGRVDVTYDQLFTLDEIKEGDGVIIVSSGESISDLEDIIK